MRHVCSIPAIAVASPEGLAVGSDGTLWVMDVLERLKEVVGGAEVKEVVGGAEVKEVLAEVETGVEVKMGEDGVTVGMVKLLAEMKAVVAVMVEVNVVV